MGIHFLQWRSSPKRLLALWPVWGHVLSTSTIHGDGKLRMSLASVLPKPETVDILSPVRPSVPCVLVKVAS